LLEILQYSLYEEKIKQLDIINEISLIKTKDFTIHYKDYPLSINNCAFEKNKKYAIIVNSG